MGATTAEKGEAHARQRRALAAADRAAVEDHRASDGADATLPEAVLGIRFSAANAKTSRHWPAWGVMTPAGRNNFLHG